MLALSPHTGTTSNKLVLSFLQKEEIKVNATLSLMIIDKVKRVLNCVITNIYFCIAHYCYILINIYKHLRDHSFKSFDNAQSFNNTLKFVEKT